MSALPEAFGPKHEEVERALAHAVANTGHLVPGAQIERYWYDANGEGPRPKEVQERRWRRLLRFGLEAGRVYVVCDGGVFWGLSTAQGLTPLPPTPRERPAFRKGTLARCAVYEAALDRALAKRGRLVTAPEVCAELRLSGAGRVTSDRLVRNLAPAIDAGRVIVTEGTRLTYYGTGSRPELGLPPISEWSDLAKVEEALRRAVADRGAAVHPTFLETVIASAPELSLRADLTPAHHLQVLVRERRAERVVAPGAVVGSHGYYTTVGGPTRCDATQMFDLDRRRAAIHAFWRATAGRPFTTRAVRLFAERRRDPIVDDAPYLWTNALHHLERTGELVAIRGQGCRFVRWAIATEWKALQSAARDDRLRDEYRVLVEGDPTDEDFTVAEQSTRVLARSAPAHDVGFASRAQNMRTLVERAKQRAAAGALSAADALALAQRPVTAEDVNAVANDCRHLVGGADDVRMMLHEASRARTGMVRNPALVRFAVGRTTYFDTERSEAAGAFKEFKETVHRVRAARLAAGVERLLEATDLAQLGIQPPPDRVLREWASGLLMDVERSVGALKRVLPRAPLLGHERDQGAALLRELEDCARPVRSLLATLGGGAPVPTPPPGDTVRIPDSALVDVSVAWSQIAPFADFTIANARLLTTMTGPTVPVVRRPISRPQPGRKGRRVEVYLDRLAFAAWTLMRWGSPHWASFAAHAMSVLGGVRNPEPFMECLADPSQKSAHAGAIAALGLFDDAQSRGAVAAYIDQLVVAPRSGGALVTAVAAAAVYALAPKPAGGLTTALSTDERSALDLLTTDRAGEYARQAAGRVMRAWAMEPDVGSLLSL